MLQIAYSVDLSLVSHDPSKIILCRFGAQETFPIFDIDIFPRFFFFFCKKKNCIYFICIVL